MAIVRKPVIGLCACVLMFCFATYYTVSIGRSLHMFIYVKEVGEKGI
jgi:hypothetical protein